MGLLNVDEFLGRTTQPKQCDTHSSSERCPDAAFYLVERSDRPAFACCLRCVTAAIFHGTNRGKIVTISRIEN